MSRRGRSRGAGQPPVLTALLLVALAACSPGRDGGQGAVLGGGSGPTTTRSGPAPLMGPVPAPGPGAVVTPTGVAVPVTGPAEGGGWAVTTPCGRPAVVRSGTYVASATVVLDPGHGGIDPGAVSPGGLWESVVNLGVSEYARDALEEAGFTVLLTRSADYDLELPVRAELAKAVGARAFISVHHNAEPDGPSVGPGSETYYQIASPDSKRLAGLLYEEIIRALSRYDIAWMADRDAGAKYREGSRGDFYAVLRQPAPIVSALVEAAFISNPPEAELLARPEVQELEGEAIARAVIRYLTTADPGSGFVEPYPRGSPPGGGGGVSRCTDPALE
ncbi:MAG: N-acetylmuramoyl-L-alanine amidase [Actinomycetota bacterium]